MSDWESKRITVGIDKICHCCKKEFLWQPEWAYKSWKGTTRVWFCSYSCMRKNNK